MRNFCDSLEFDYQFSLDTCTLKRGRKGHIKQFLKGLNLIRCSILDGVCVCWEGQREGLRDYIAFCVSDAIKRI